MLKLVVFIFLIGFSMVGCRTVQPSVEKTHTVKDSTWTVVRYHKKDTTITIPGDVSFISLPISHITDNPVKKSSGRATATVSRSGDNIQVQCECAEFKQKIEFLETEITHLQKIIELQKEFKTDPYPFVPWHIKTLAWIGGAALAGLAIVIALKLFLK